MIKQILSFLFVIITAAASAQPADSPQMADGFRQDGKIYVVITVIGIIFLAIVLFLVYLDRKVKKLEEQVHNTKTGN